MRSTHNRIFDNQKGIGIGDLLVLLAVVCAAVAFYMPEILKQEADPSLVIRAKTDLQTIAQNVSQMESHTNLLAGYPGVNPCVNDLEFDDLNHCRIGLICNDGKYQNWSGPYSKSIPLDPWGNKYYLDNDYYHNGTISRVLGSKGPNGVQDYKDGDDVILVLCSDNAVAAGEL